MARKLFYGATTITLIYFWITAFALFQWVYEGRTGSWEIWGAPLRVLYKLIN